MKGFDSFPFFPGDWFGSATVRLMSRECRSVYLDVMCLQWQLFPGPLPMDPGRIRGALGVEADVWDRCWPKMSAKFPEADPGDENSPDWLKSKGRVMGKLAGHFGYRLGCRRGGEKSRKNKSTPKSTPKSTLKSTPKSNVTLPSPSSEKKKKTPSSSSVSVSPLRYETSSVSAGPKPDAVDWSEALDRWNRLAVEHGKPQLMPRSLELPARRVKYRAQLKRFPDFWSVLERELPLLSDFHREHRYPNFDMALRPSWFPGFAEGNHRDPGKAPKSRLEQEVDELFDRVNRGGSSGR